MQRQRRNNQWTTTNAQESADAPVRLSIVRAGDVVMSLQEDGKLVVFKSGPAAFETLKRYKVAEAETWTQPALSGNRIFGKDVSTLALWTLN